MSNEEIIRELSVHGLTKDTELEPMIKVVAEAEAAAVMMYYALARLAKEQGLNEAAATFIESGNQEAVHAGFYATLNGKYPKDFWQFVAGVAKAEYKGEKNVLAVAEKVRAAGLTAAADQMEIYAKQEHHHGEVLDELLKKCAPKIDAPAQKKWVCAFCGYEHTGDAPPDVCPICGQPSATFKEKVEPESLHGVTKGTSLESLSQDAMRAEINGARMYHALACIAKEQGLEDMAKTLTELGNQEAQHAGFYAMISGKYPKDFWELLCKVQKLESEGEQRGKGFADIFRKGGFTEVADIIDGISKQEGHHGAVIAELFKKYNPDFKPTDTVGKKLYVCPCCGYEYFGDLDAEPENWTCPVCGQPKKDFKLIENAPEQVAEGQKVFVCSVCGYEHTGDAPPDVCPICGQPSAVFKEKVSKIKISAVKLYDGGFMMKSFACGGGLPEGSSPEEKLRSSLQNYVIDTGKEVILVDTGTPAEMEFPVTADSKITMGDKVANYVDALKTAGYEPEQVSKILVTHKHPDHTGELRAFPNAKIYISRLEADDMNLTGDNIVRTDFTDGAYKNFNKCQKIADGVYYIFAPGHTKGNSIVIVEAGDIFYMIHGDVTYTDEALLENKLSVAFEDFDAARDTLNRVRAFIKENKTVYLSTHTPLGYENLEAQKIMKLPEIDETPIAENKADESEKVSGTVWVCSVCGYEHVGNVPPDICPICSQPASSFSKK